MFSSLLSVPELFCVSPLNRRTNSQCPDNPDHTYTQTHTHTQTTPTQMHSVFMSAWFCTADGTMCWHEVFSADSLPQKYTPRAKNVAGHSLCPATHTHTHKRILCACVCVYCSALTNCHLPHQSDTTWKFISLMQEKEYHYLWTGPASGWLCAKSRNVAFTWHVSPSFVLQWQACCCTRDNLLVAPVSIHNKANLMFCLSSAAEALCPSAFWSVLIHLLLQHSVVLLS